VPLILSGQGGQTLTEAEMRCLLDWAREVEPAVHAVVSAATGTGVASVRLTVAGREWLATRPWAARRPWSGQRWREDWMLRALTVLHALQRDRDYAVRDGAIVFIDPITGRAAPERQWSRGLHQMLALKEGLEMPAAQQTLAQLTYQRLFNRYHQIGGMSGTLSEVALEMALTYGTPVIRVPRHRASQLVDLGVRVHADTEARWDAVCERATAVLASGRAVLIGTASVAESERLAERLRARALRPMVLNAVQSGLENEVIARAGRPGRLTVSTQMAGRGTDIRLDPDVLAAGGLHVIACADAYALRQWRQLIGRAGRQGDPGTHETLVWVGDGVLFRRLPGWLATTLVRKDPASRWTRALWRGAMWLDEWAQTRERRALLRQDRAWAARMAYSGSEE
jgi:preprotein translocase subunit SecA